MRLIKSAQHMLADHAAAFIVQHGRAAGASMVGVSPFRSTVGLRGASIHLGGQGQPGHVRQKYIFTVTKHTERREHSNHMDAQSLGLPPDGRALRAIYIKAV